EGSILNVLVNRTPVAADVYAAREKREIIAYGCGLADTIAHAPNYAQFVIWLNVITPYMPITSDGKEPDLAPFVDTIADAVGKAVRRAHRPNAADRVSQKEIVLDHLDEAIADASGDGEFRFNQRQLFYLLRPIVMDKTGEVLSTANFNGII